MHPLKIRIRKIRGRSTIVFYKTEGYCKNCSGKEVHRFLFYSSDQSITMKQFLKAFNAIDHVISRTGTRTVLSVPNAHKKTKSGDALCNFVVLVNASRVEEGIHPINSTKWREWHHVRVSLICYQAGCHVDDWI
jgi:hypothetical protein